MAFQVDYIVLSIPDSSNRYVALSGTPLVSSNVAMDIIGGTSQALTGDFYVDGTSVKWDAPAYGLYSMLDASSRIRVIYDRSSV